MTHRMYDHGRLVESIQHAVHAVHQLPQVDADLLSLGRLTVSRRKSLERGNLPAKGRDKSTGGLRRTLGDIVADGTQVSFRLGRDAGPYEA
jgi:hypothetical protein